MAYEVGIRCYNLVDLNVLLDMTNEEGWEISDLDLRASLQVDPKGLLVAEDKSGTPVGFIGLFDMTPGMTYVNVFIVKKDLRRKGIGKELWSAMVKTTKGNILVLDSVLEMTNWYKDQGFLYKAYSSKYCKGTITSITWEVDHRTCDIVPVSEDVWSAVVAYDKNIYPFDRENVLRAWFRGTETYSIVALRNTTVVGYANFHWKSEKECNIRALFGDDQAVAEELLVDLLHHISVGTIVTFYLMVDKPMPKYVAEFQTFDEVHRLYTKEIKGIQTDKVFFCTTYMI